MTRAANSQKLISHMHDKYVDNLTIAEALNLKNVLVVEREQSLKRPLNYHQRTEHKIVADSSQVEQKLKDRQEHARLNEMKINQKKTKILLFNTSIKYDFHS